MSERKCFGNARVSVLMGLCLASIHCLGAKGKGQAVAEVQRLQGKH